MEATVTTFDGRIRKAVAFEDEVADFLSQFGDVAKNGTEHTHPDFVKLIRSDTSATAKLIRFQPDGVCLLQNGVTYWEAKAGASIEKDAWITYERYTTLGARVLLFVKDHYKRERPKVFYGYVGPQIGFKPNLPQFYVDDEGWMAPRVRGPKTRGSNTPFRFIDTTTMTEIPNWV